MNRAQAHARDAESDRFSSISETSNSDKLIEQILGRRMQEHERTKATFALAQDPRPPTFSADEVANGKLSRRPHDHAPCVCPECGKPLSRLDSLMRHRKRVHGVRSRHYCDRPECAKHPGFSLSDNLRRHMKISHGITIEAYEVPPNSHRPSPTSGQVGLGKTESKFSFNQVQQPPADGYAALPDLVRGSGGDLSSSRIAGLDDLEHLDRQSLIQRLRAKAVECEKLQKQCHVLRLERDEYAEALAMSEQRRKKLDAEKR
ncbi:hypothetical protein F4809DRAFT_537458 [Biscogniauxia mediterranea]|nr:hypothetical protein F4809DRAFT_537458 [Biscogniauxia mediterranea]